MGPGANCMPPTLGGPVFMLRDMQYSELMKGQLMMSEVSHVTIVSRKLVHTFFIFIIYIMMVGQPELTLTCMHVSMLYIYSCMTALKQHLIENIVTDKSAAWIHQCTFDLRTCNMYILSYLQTSFKWLCTCKMFLGVMHIM